MGYEKQILKNGNGADKPNKGDTVTIEYIGNLQDASQPNNKGKEFDASTNRPGDFKTPIGVGKVIKGWDEGVLTMSLGERAVLTITSDFAYGERGFYDLIPPNSTLIFEVELKGINDKFA